jgi:hypothetical protein
MQRGLKIEPIDAGFDYRISLADILKPKMTLTQAGTGSAEESIVLTTSAAAVLPFFIARLLLSVPRARR